MLSVQRPYEDASGKYHGFLDIDGNFTTLDDANAHIEATAWAINNAGTIVGFYDESTGFLSGFIATPETVPEPSSRWIYALRGALSAGRRVCVAAP